MKSTPNQRTGIAQLYAASLEVQCPRCGEPQPDPDVGSHLWTPEQVREASTAGGKRACVACDAPFRIIQSTKVQVL